MAAARKAQSEGCFTAADWTAADWTAEEVVWIAAAGSSAADSAGRYLAWAIAKAVSAEDSAAAPVGWSVVDRAFPGPASLVAVPVGSCYLTPASEERYAGDSLVADSPAAAAVWNVAAREFPAPALLAAGRSGVAPWAENLAIQNLAIQAWAALAAVANTAIRGAEPVAMGALRFGEVAGFQAPAAIPAELAVLRARSPERHYET